ncbi:MAG TPA: SUF system NifU family Fe-S cluster assembly protein [Planctomycetota bacterium]|nr:SUF system NifU family Fe-S cluster assembly protein [Planctomycetota bacterium]
MTGAFDDLYQELILDHYRKPRNRGALDNPSSSVELNNPLCGDVIAIDIRLVGDRIDQLQVHGQGCSISQASASMMTQLVKGKTVAEAAALVKTFKELMRGEGSFDAVADRLGDLVALQGVMKFPARIKCATLAWNALQLALEGKTGKTSTTEA